VAIPPHVVPAVAHHLEAFTGPGPDDLLFPAADGASNLQPSSVYKYWHEARAKAGRPDLRIHDLRHTGATMAAMASATLAELQQRLGHSSVNAALRYQHAAQGRDRQIAEALSRMSNPKGE
jgi:integrase